MLNIHVKFDNIFGPINDSIGNFPEIEKKISVK